MNKTSEAKAIRQRLELERMWNESSGFMTRSVGCIKVSEGLFVVCPYFLVKGRVVPDEENRAQLNILDYY